MIKFCELSYRHNSLNLLLAWLNPDYYFHRIYTAGVFCVIIFKLTVVTLWKYVLFFSYTINQLVIDSSLLGRIDLSPCLSLVWSVTSGSNSYCSETLSQFRFAVHVLKLITTFYARRIIMCNFYVIVESMH